MYNAVYQTADVFENICPEYLDKSQQFIDEENSKKEVYRIYPIPNKGEFFIKGELEIGFSVQIMNTTGSMVFEKKTSEEVNEQFIQTHLSSGTYMVVVSNTKGEEVYRENIVVIQ